MIKAINSTTYQPSKTQPKLNLSKNSKSNINFNGKLSETGLLVGGITASGAGTLALIDTLVQSNGLYEMFFGIMSLFAGVLMLSPNKQSNNIQA